MLLLAFSTGYLVLSTTVVVSIFLVTARRRDDRQRSVEDTEQMRALRPARASLTSTGVFSTQH